MLEIHQDIIKNNLQILVERTRLDDLVVELINKKVFNREMIDRIRNSSKHPKQQITDVYVETFRRGPEAFENLKKALLETGHFDLYNILMESDSNSSCFEGASLASMSLNEVPDSMDLSTTRNEYLVGEPSPKQSNGINQKSPLISNLNIEDNDKVLQPAVNFSSLDKKAFIERYPVGSPIEVIRTKNWPKKTSYINHYKNDSNPRGKCLIINNYKFLHHAPRNGSDNDVRKLKSLMSQLHYQTVVKQNCTKEEMRQIVYRFSKDPGLRHADSIILIVMSHGCPSFPNTEDTIIISTDYLNDGLKISEIVDYFSNENCSDMINKAKVFIFQSCRGDNFDTGVVVDGHSLLQRVQADGARKENKPIKVSSRSDIFIAFPVPPGDVAIRDNLFGSYFIQAIVDVFREYAHSTHLEDLMKVVEIRMKEISNQVNTNFQAVTINTIGWTKHLYFCPGIYKDSITGNTYEVQPLFERTCNGAIDTVDFNSQEEEKAKVGCSMCSIH